MENNALEKAMQKNNFLQVRILRDKITSLTRQQNLLSRRYGAMLKRQPPNNVALEGTEKRLDELEAQICDLEVELMALQDSEVQRRSRAIANCQEEAARASLSLSAILVDNSLMVTARESMSPLTTGTTGGKDKEDQSMLAFVTDNNTTDGGGKEEPPTLAVVANNAAEDYDAADGKVKEKPPMAVVAANNAADKKVEERTLADILKDPRERERIASGLKKGIRTMEKTTT